MNGGRRLRSARAGTVDNRRLRHDRRHSSDQDALDLVERNGIGLYGHAVRALAASGGKDGADPWISKGVVDIRQAVLVATSQIVTPRVERMRPYLHSETPSGENLNAAPDSLLAWRACGRDELNPITRSQPLWLNTADGSTVSCSTAAMVPGIEAAVGGRDGQVLSNEVFTDAFTRRARLAGDGVLIQPLSSQAGSHGYGIVTFFGEKPLLARPGKAVIG